jgi:hypothetical protein
MTKEELERTHPDYKRNLAQWQFFIRSYFGGRFYREGNYLLQHPFESSANYERRKQTAYYYNYCAPVVDIMSAHLFKRPPKRDFGNLSGDPLFEEFFFDSDLEGSSFSQFMRDAQKFASIYGSVSIVVDKPAIPAATLAEAHSLGVRPYVGIITPENLLDWGFARLATGKEVLAAVKIMESPGRYRIWTRDRCELWEMGEDGPALVEQGIHPLGRVPLVNLYNKRSGIKMIGISDLQDIADINKNIYYLSSDAKEIIENTAFPMLAMPFEKGSADSQVGPRNILEFDPELPGARPYWLEAPHSSLSEIREWIKQDVSEIYRIAKMGGVRATEDSHQARSGVAIELEHQQMHAVLAEKADNVEQAEYETLELWARWQGVAFDGTIDYPDDFSIKDLDRDLERAVRTLSVEMDSKTFKKELKKSIVEATLPKADEETKRLIFEEMQR